MLDPLPISRLRNICDPSQFKFDTTEALVITSYSIHYTKLYEQQVEKKLGGKQKKELLSTAEVRQMCRDHAKEFIDIQREEFKKLGVVADWDNPYLTMDSKFEANRNNFV